MKTTLITGISGFLGGHLATIAKDQFRVAGLFHTYTAEIPGVRTFYSSLKDFTVLQKNLDEIQADVIIHNAAMANPDTCEANPAEAEKINVGSSEFLAKWCETNDRRMVFISTDMVFDGTKGNYREKDEVNPLSIYAKTKAKAEIDILTHCRNSLICRIALMYGKGVFDRLYGSEWLERELIKRKNNVISDPVVLFHDQFRSMISVSKAAEAVTEAAGRDIRGILHIAGSERVSRFDFGRKLCAVLKIPETFIVSAKYDDANIRTPRPKDVSLNITKARSLLTTQFQNIETGLREIYP
ncbi:MAG: SDR family oxidoreductase [Candidatus Marinimicrobia bacterium]|nr:SDR family oxidoreductase [Candidatus Neomarinimicrobiota bacterium]